MATATKKVHLANSKARTAASNRASLAFVISQDNRGDYLWEIVDNDGKAVAESGGFESHDDAERAAHYVHESARLAHFVPRDVEEPDIVAA